MSKQYQTEYIRKLFNMLCEYNNVNRIFINQKEFNNKYKTKFMTGLFFDNGNLILNQDSRHYKLWIHELCHLLVTPPEYRKYFTGSDIMNIYDNINKLTKGNFKLNLRESTTIALQHILFCRFNIGCWFASDFYKGYIGQNYIKTNVNINEVRDVWIDIANKIDYVKFDENFIIAKNMEG